MPKRSSNDVDLNQLAAFLVNRATNHINKRKKNPAAVALGRLGGLKGGRARANKLHSSERSRIARKAATSRWRRMKKGT